MLEDILITQMYVHMFVGMPLLLLRSILSFVHIYVNPFLSSEKIIQFLIVVLFYLLHS